MDSTQVTALTTAFDTSTLLTTFQSLAPYIIGVVGVITAIGVITWGVRKVSRRLSHGV